MRYVSDVHKEELAKVHAIKVVQVAMVEATLTLGADASNSTVTDHITERLDGLYELCSKPRKAGLGEGIKNANYSLCFCKGFIERGGGHDNTDPSLQYGQWRFAPGGYEAARNWIANYDHIKALIDDINSPEGALLTDNEDQRTPDAVDEVIAISVEDDTYPRDKDGGKPMVDPNPLPVDEQIRKLIEANPELGESLAELNPAVARVKLKMEIKEALQKVAGLYNEIGELFDKLSQ